MRRKVALVLSLRTGGPGFDKRLIHKPPSLTAAFRPTASAAALLNAGPFRLCSRRVARTASHLCVPFGTAKTMTTTRRFGVRRPQKRMAH